MIHFLGERSVYRELARCNEETVCDVLVILILRSFFCTLVGENKADGEKSTVDGEEIG